MATLYLVSTESYTGKTALCVAVGLEYQHAGLSVTYLKPLGSAPVVAGARLVDEDCLFAHQALGLHDPLGLTCPAVFTPEADDSPFRAPGPSMLATVQKAHARLAAVHDLVLMEGPASLAEGFSLEIPPATLANAFNAVAVIVSRYHPGLSIDHILMAQSTLGDQMRGVIVNSVPGEALDAVKRELAPCLQQHGLALFGALPQDKLLTAISVRDLVSLLKGELLCAPEKQDELVESFTVGAMSVDSALKHFMHAPDKAVITGGDRADIQLAALQTSTRCLLLTGNLYPDRIVLARAAALGVPVILVPGDTMAAVETLGHVLGRIRLSNPRQIERLRAMVRRDVDLTLLAGALGISKKRERRD